MAKTILISDETQSGTVLNQVLLTIEEDSLTLGELIKKRIKEEVAPIAEKMKRSPIFQKQAKRKEAHMALHAFRENGFFILINNRQVQDLDQQIPLNNALTVRFIALSPKAM